MYYLFSSLSELFPFLNKLEISQPIALNFFKWQHHGTEELAHLEMVGTIVHQLTEGVCPEEIEKAGLGAYYTDHGVDIYPQSAGGTPFTASYDAVMIRRMMKT